MIDPTELRLLRHRISDGIKGDFKILDHKCTNCGVGIDKNKETFIVTPESIEIWCESCRKGKLLT